MRLTRLNLQTVEGVSFAQAGLDLPPCPVRSLAEIHLFTGPNGCGKSALLSGIAPARAITVRDGRLDESGSHRSGAVLGWVTDVVRHVRRTTGANAPFILAIDEVEAHLHPHWQRRVLPVVQKMFPRAQVFVATHSPLVVGSVRGAWIHPMRLLEDGRTSIDEPRPSMAGSSNVTIMRDLFDVPEFDVETEGVLADFRAARNAVLGGDVDAVAELERHAADLRERGVETRTIVELELHQLRRRMDDPLADLKGVVRDIESRRPMTFESSRELVERVLAETGQPVDVDEWAARLAASAVAADDY